MLTPIPWHRLFGMALTDLFTGRPWQVELEKELALKSQRLDVLIIEQQTNVAGGVDAQALAGLPDGLENLAAHNVLTYKSAHEALDAWAIEELLGHYVTYRKLASGRNRDERETCARTNQRLLPAAAFRLYAVATRMPEKLLGQLPAPACRPTTWPGVFDLLWGTRAVRLVVLDAITQHPRNAPWELFSSNVDRIRHGLAHYQPHGSGPGSLLAKLLVNYRAERPEMTYTVEDFKRDAQRSFVEFIARMTPEERQELLRDIAVEERLQGLDPEQIVQRLDPEQRLQGLDPEQRLEGLDPETVKAWLKRRTEH